MAGYIFIIRCDIRHGHDGPRVDTPGAIFGLPGPQDAATAPLIPTVTLRQTLQMRG